MSLIPSLYFHSIHACVASLRFGMTLAVAFVLVWPCECLGTQTEGASCLGRRRSGQGSQLRAAPMAPGSGEGVGGSGGRTRGDGGRSEVSREWGAHRFGMTLAVAVVLVSIATAIGTSRNQQERWSTCHVPQLHHLAGRPSPHRFFPFAMMYLSNHVESKCERAHMQSFHLHSNIVLR